MGSKRKCTVTSGNNPVGMDRTGRQRQYRQKMERGQGSDTEKMQLGGNQSVSKLMDFGSFLEYSKLEG